MGASSCELRRAGLGEKMCEEICLATAMPGGLTFVACGEVTSGMNNTEMPSKIRNSRVENGYFSKREVGHGPLCNFIGSQNLKHVRIC